ncbi:MAG: VanZ family protein [Candidatus Omnitrophota bacterium]
MKKFIFYWLPFFIWSGFLYYLSSRPAYFFPKTNIPFSDKIVHVFEYIVFSILLFRALKAYIKNFKYIFIIFIVLYCTVVFGMIDELHQAFVPGRNAAMPDLVSDMLGAIIGITLIR